MSIDEAAYDRHMADCERRRHVEMTGERPVAAMRKEWMG